MAVRLPSNAPSTDPEGTAIQYTTSQSPVQLLCEATSVPAAAPTSAQQGKVLKVGRERSQAVKVVEARSLLLRPNDTGAFREW